MVCTTILDSDRKFSDNLVPKDDTVLLETEIDSTMWLGRFVPGLENDPDVARFIGMLSGEYRKAALRILFESNGIKQSVVSSSYIENLIEAEAQAEADFCGKRGLEPSSHASLLDHYNDILVKSTASVLKILNENGKIETIIVDREAFDKFCAENNCDARTNGRYLFLKSIGIDGVGSDCSGLELIFSDSPMIHMPFN